MNTITRIAFRITAALTVLIVALAWAATLLGSVMPTDEIAFDSLRTGNHDIYLLDIRQNIRLRLTRSSANEYSAAWSPDGEYLAYISESEDDRAIYVMGLSNRERYRLTSIALLGMNPALAWSPDGTTLALSTTDDSNTQGIFLIDTDGSNLRRVSESNGSAFTPTWSKNEQIAFSWSPVANTEIYVMSIAEPESVQAITNNMYTDTSPAWAPDGSEIAFMSDRDGRSSDIYLMYPDGSDLRQITHDPSRETTPTWSPDSEWIAYVSIQAGNSDLFAVRRDGSIIRQLTFDNADELRPAWRP